MITVLYDNVKFFDDSMQKNSKHISLRFHIDWNVDSFDNHGNHVNGYTLTILRSNTKG